MKKYTVPQMDVVLVDVENDILTISNGDNEIGAGDIFGDAV